jgi:ubiquinone/menaquinone biosynthesis C-methylase UbiE
MQTEPQNHIKTINDFQQQQYEIYGKNTAESLIKQYSALLETYKEKEVLKILDVGGASGYFAMALSKYFGEKICEIVVVDTTKYSTWIVVNRSNNIHNINFIEDFVENLNKYFSENTFDLIFANRVFHHFVNKTWEKTIASINYSMAQITRVLKNDGCFCVTDYFYDGYFFNTSSSKIIYTLTSCKNPLLISIFRKIESQSAGIGVCFLSRKMWFDLFDRNGLSVEQLREGCPVNYSLFRKFIYKIILLIKNCQEDVIMILKKNTK